nr:hypothetical protein [Human alphaherpesvirus 2]
MRFLGWSRWSSLSSWPSFGGKLPPSRDTTNKSRVNTHAGSSRGIYRVPITHKLTPRLFWLVLTLY